MKNKKTFFYCIVFFSLLAQTAFAGKKKDKFEALWKSPYSVEIESLGVGYDGSKMVKAWAYGKNADMAIIEAKKNAISAVIFKGIPAGNGAASTPAICKDPNALEKNQDFFNNFFKDGGKYLQFINISNDGMPGGSDRIKMKKGYKVAIKASVAYNNLRKYLEEQGIAKRMDMGF